jgi:hypothetical protein
MTPTATTQGSITFRPIGQDRRAIGFAGEIFVWPNVIYQDGRRLANKDGDTWYLGPGAGQYDGLAVTIEED